MNMKKTLKQLLGISMLFLAVFAVSCNDDPEVDPNDFVVDRNDLKGTIGSGDSIVLESGTYELTGALVVGNGAALTIKAGVKIEATSVASSSDYGSVRYIAVAQGGRIYVQGTASAPVVMTATETKPGSWGGLVIAGKAPINKGTSASAEVSDL